MADWYSEYAADLRGRGRTPLSAAEFTEELRAIARHVEKSPTNGDGARKQVRERIGGVIRQQVEMADQLAIPN